MLYSSAQQSTALCKVMFDAVSCVKSTIITVIRVIRVIIN